MSPEYLAGFIDGEGCFTISKARRSHYTPVVSITNTDKSVLEKICSYFGGRLHSKGRAGKIGWKQAYSVVWAGSSSVLQLLDKIEPYLEIKVRQAACLRRLIEHFSPLVSLGRGYKVTEEAVQLRESIKQEIHNLNRRGNPINS